MSHRKYTQGRERQQLDLYAESEETVNDLKEFAKSKGFELKHHSDILSEAVSRIVQKYGSSSDRLKDCFDALIEETEQTAYELYLEYEEEYGGAVLRELTTHEIQARGIEDPTEVGEALSKQFKVLDRFYLSLAQSRKSRAGRVFETIHNLLFKALDYPFDEQQVINGKPDFVMPSVAHYRQNPLECVVFTAKRTLRERWRQIVTEGTRGIGFYLATIDPNVSANQLDEMVQHKIYVVVPGNLKQSAYADASNVLSFQSFFEDHLDPKMKIWQRDGII